MFCAVHNKFALDYRYLHKSVALIIRRPLASCKAKLKNM